MGDTVNIQNLLQAGYFKTSRARSKSPGPDSLAYDEERYRYGRPADRTEPRYERQYERLPSDTSPIRLPPPPKQHRVPSRNRPAPPPPTVDDEESILSKEHGYSKTIVPEEEASSRGDADQNPAIVEVHEFNPERRFVILDDDLVVSTATAAETTETESTTKDVPTSSKKSPDLPEKPVHCEDSGRYRRHAPSVGVSPPPTGRRRSRQDLPVLDTEFGNQRSSEHHRSRSAVNGPRPDYFAAARSPRPYGDQLLSPDVRMQSSKGKEESYSGGDYRARSRERRQSGRISPERPRRSETGHESRSSRRTNSTDRGGERRYREYYSGSFREDNSSRPNHISARDSAWTSTHVSRESSRSKEEYPRTSQTSSSQKPIVLPEDGELKMPTVPKPEPIKTEKIQSRAQTTPLPAVPSHGLDKPPILKPAATINLAKEADNIVPFTLPYPDEDALHFDPLSLPRLESKRSDGPAPTAYMPRIPTEAPRYNTADSASSQKSSPASEAKEWRPPSFDPERDGAKLERPVGTYRRYSENPTEPSGDRLPNCPRMKPVAGKVDWLTLPRTDFNICPDCYGQVFSNSDYRTHFHPVLRSTMDEISCDFGSSPWYRIAWLLILKNKDADLKVFHDIAAVSVASRGYGCPGDRKTTRDWYTVRDPYTKRPVPEFTVCYQCAKTVEALLPSLGGVFEPLDSRLNSPIRSNCSLRFAPDRTDFVLYFDSFETTADKAQSSKKGPDMGYLAQKLERLCVHNECREDRPVSNGYWHFMQFLPEFTVCADCFEDVVKPRLSDENIIARNFYIKPQKISQATCQLYSSRMREVFKRACRRNDPKYLEGKVRERLSIESSIKNKLSKLDRNGPRDPRTDKQIDDLIEEWKEWE